MPQFDASTFPSQLFWLFITFLVLFLFTQFVTAPKIGKVLKSRDDKQEADHQAADSYNRESEKILGELDAELDKARAQARESVATTTHQLAMVSTQRRADIMQMMNDRLMSSESRIQRQKKQALGDLKSISETVSVMTVEKLLNLNLDRDEARKVLDEVIPEEVA